MEREAGFEPVSLVDGNHVFYLVNFSRKCAMAGFPILHRLY